MLRLPPLAALLACLLGLACRQGEVPASAPAAAAAVEPYRAGISELLRRGLAEGRAYELLEGLCGVAPHRLAGSAGAELAVDWAERTLTELGFEEVRRESCAVPHWERGEVEELVFRAPARLAGEPLRILALGGSVATPAGGLAAELIEVRDFEELERRAAEVRGRLVLFNRPMDAGLVDTFRAYGEAVDQRVHGARRAAELGAVGVLVRSLTTRLDDVPHTGSLRYGEGPPIPAAAVSTLGAERLAALLAAGERVELRLELVCRTRSDKPSWNVIGELRGREHPEQVLVVGGHLDAWDVGQGAHDDGAGCCQSIEAVRLLLEAGLRPRRTIRVVLFMNEENGLAGGRAYRDQHAAELEHHVAALESDRGGFVPRGFTTDAGPGARELLEAATALLEPAGMGLLKPGGGGADIGPLARDGVVLVGLLPDSSRYFDVHHSERDTLEAVNPRELQLGAVGMAALLWVLADLEQTLPRNEPAR